MPIKLPKGFARRKSSGNVLEDVDGHPQPSFRVFERPGNPQRSMTDGDHLTKRMSDGHIVSSMLEDSDNIFAGTEHASSKNRYDHEHDRPRTMDSLRKRLTGHHRHSGATYESSGSTRLSSSSTQPSSTEVPPPDDASSPHSRIHDIPAPPPPLAGALRAAGRTFSFGGRFSKNSTPPAPRMATPDTSSRERTHTSGTDETATPPRLPDSQLQFDLSAGGDDDFGKMFDHLGKRSSAILRDPSPQRTTQYSSSPPTQALPEFKASDSRATRPAAITTDRSVPVEPSPYSWSSHHSDENLLKSPSSRMVTSPSQSTTETFTGVRKPSPSPGQMLGTTAPHRGMEKSTRRQSGGLRKSGIYSAEHNSRALDDEDARLVRQSILWTKENSPPHWSDGASPSNGTPLLDKGKSTSPSGPLSPAEDNMFAHRPSPAPSDHGMDDVRLAVQFAENLPKTASPPGNKVMTPSQFEHYRQQQELRRSNSDASKSDDESEHEDLEDEQDEVEKQRETERQRRKQEAHLSVYRQQMKKVTGQQTPSPSLRPVMTGASSSTPNLVINRLSNPGDKSSSGKSSNEDDDDEVPLGILAAHGFPNRNRPPTRLTNANSNPNLRASMAHPYASSAASLVGGEAGNRGSLPVFARNLPRDPYFGASLVNPSNRESLALGGGSGSVYGGPSSPVPPGGLINVIANEERQKAMRRGSPNAQAMMHEQQMQMQMQMQMGGGIPRPYSMMGPPPMSPSEQANVQLSNQMADMMRLQMEFMEKMMTLQGMQGTPSNDGKRHMMGGMPMQGGAMRPPSMAGGPAMARPASVMGGHPNMGMRPASLHSAAGAMPPHVDQRTLSMIDPNIAARRGSPMPHLPPGPPFHSNTGSYAPSIAPSERSNTGLASRYRPVSVMQGDSAHSISSLNKGWNDENLHRQSQLGLPKSSSLATVTVRPMSRTSEAPGGQRPMHASDEDDDDEGWADMMKKRDKKKSSWKLKRGTSSFGDLLSAVH
ncbi:hypothetical protein N7462_008719 [Penicillium macrosclerotiorum]|uniref:uncharacterized protein n=1 Tax=Penicillium macrosclerotiorum TaxID=303699 RepID=UPI0025472D44|nr:uncharacterized protein N7462_008719 [Penicillium macrosclerotiorum]KAJ5675822.1 hypothetical protein N7462_008719 [Penicillium macrosclerotiorum]